MHLKRRDEMNPAALAELISLAKKFQDTSLSESSKKAYRADWEIFQNFCKTQNLVSLPATSETICLYITQCAKDKKSVHTIVRSLTSVNKAHELAGYPPIRDPLVRATLRGVKKQLGLLPGKAKAISYFEILRMADKCEPSLIGARDKAILLIGWCSALRRSELTALNIEDVEFVHDKGLILTVKRSKTDPDGRGARIGIPYARGPLCAVRSLEKWIGRLFPEDRQPGKPLFLSIGSGGQRRWYKKGHRGRLTPRMISILVKKYARLSGLPENRYSAHSLRRGLATAAAAAHIPERIIARQTRHKSMAVLREYIEEGNIWEENPLSVIYGSAPSSAPSSQ